MRYLKVVISLVFFFPLLLQAQDLLPFTENFTKNDYNGDNQVWGVVQGSDNAMYFANNHYFLRYDGVRWEKYTLPGKTIIRSVMAEGDRIYCGSYREFGYWQRRGGRMQYHSVSRGKTLFTGISGNEEIWKIFRSGNSVYFQSFNELYEWSGGNITKSRFPSLVSYCYVIGGTIYAATVSDGVFYKTDGGFRPVPGWEALKNKVLHGMEGYGGKIYSFTKNDGIYVTTSTGIVPWEHSLNARLKTSGILSAKLIAKNKLAVGTSLSGIFIIDMADGNFININRSNSLRNNAVLSIGLDRENDIWLGLDNGISHIEVNSPVRILTDNSGELGSVYSMAVYKNGYLLGTNHGLFDYTDSKLLRLPQSQGQVWDIANAGQDYIIGHNDGTYRLSGGVYSRMSDVHGGWNCMYSKIEKAYFQANYSGIAVYYDPSDLSRYKVLSGLTKPVRNLAQNRMGELWATDIYKGLYRIEFDPDFNVTSVRNVTRECHINDDYSVKLVSFGNEIHFFIAQKWYQYNPISKKLENDPLFSHEFIGISDVIQVTNSTFIIKRNSLLYYITYKSGHFFWEAIPPKYYDGRILPDFTRCIEDHGKLYLNLDDGFLIFDPHRGNPSGNVRIEALYEGKILDEGGRIRHNTPLEINVVSSHFGYMRPGLFYRISGKKLIPMQDGSVTLNNMGNGTNTIEVYMSQGKGFRKIASFGFYVAFPWYFSWWMVMVYIIFVATVFSLYYRWNKMKYNQRIRLHEEELKHRRQLLELELEAEDRARRQEHEKSILEVEVQYKASEVAGKSLSIAKHSEMIESIREVLETEHDTATLKKSIRNIIKTGSISKNEWQSFEKNLFKGHEEFVNRLTLKYPDLTPKDIKLSIYLKMNLSSKEIAPLMNISFRGVELHRYRLRKKLGLASDENLYKFMLAI